MAAKTHFGLEINDKEIRYLELSQKGADFALGKYGEVKLPEGVLENGSIRQGMKLLKMLEAVRKKGKWKDATVSYIPGQLYLSDILRSAGFKKIYFESAGEALGRALLHAGSEETSMIVYFSGGKMDIYAAGGKSAQLLATFNFSSGLLEKSKDKELIYSFIKEKIDEQYISWHTHKEAGKSRPKINKIILAGELSGAEDLSSYLTKALKIKAEPGQAWTNIFSFEDHIPEINFRDSLRYSAAIGLAARPFEK
jgi:Tfp pilus assembly PilM family ATPase